MYILKILLSLCCIFYAECKIHHLTLRGDSRRNIVLSEFGYGENATLDIVLSNFSVPDKISSKVDSSDNAEKSGVIGFSLSRGISIAASVGSNPHVCQLQQFDQNFDALFFIADLPSKRLRVLRTGIGKDIKLCPSHEACDDFSDLPGLSPPAIVTTPSPTIVPYPAENRTKRDGYSIIQRLKNLFIGGDSEPKAYINYIPLEQTDNLYSTNISIRFTEQQKGKYYLIFHNCFNYKALGYSDRVAVDFTIDIREANLFSFLSVGDIPKPYLLLDMSIIFFICGVFWTKAICLADKRDVYRVHGMMTTLVFLKTASLFFHGVNYYFVSKYGHQREIWAIVFYVTHLLKGAILFGTIILIGTGYTFFKNFFTERDRKVFMVVIPLQIVDNIAMVILEESETGQQGYQFWMEIFVFLDMLCCFAVFFPILWSMQHLKDGAKSDGKAAFNLQKLRILREFYLCVIFYIYFTRIIKVLLQFALPFDMEWVTQTVVEVATLIFFVVVGMKFKPQKRNPYLKLSLEEDCEEGDIVLTPNNLLENVKRRNGSNSNVGVGTEDIPGLVGGVSSGESDDEMPLMNKRRMDGLERTLL